MLDQIEEDEKEIMRLEKKLNVHGDTKKKDKMRRQWKIEGMGVGFMEFVEGVSSVVKGKEQKWSKREHDFLDD